MKKPCFHFLLGCVLLGPLVGRAQIRQARLLTPDDLRRNGYEEVFYDNFDSYNSRQDLQAAQIVNLSAPSQTNAKWDIRRAYYWSDPLAENKNWCDTEENVEISEDPRDRTNKFLKLKATFHAAPLDIDPGTTNLVSLDGMSIPGNWQQPGSPTRKPRFYRSTASIFPHYYGIDENNANSCNIWMNGFRYGIFEIRCKLPSRGGIQSAFWMYNGGGSGSCESGLCTGDPDFTGSWEIDGFESFNYGTGISGPGERCFFSTLQPNLLGGHPGRATYYDWQAARTQPDEEFHTYAFAWTPTGITWFIDGVETRTDDASTGIPYSTLSCFLSSHYNWYFDGTNTVYNSLNPANPDPQAPAPEVPAWFFDEAVNGPETDFLIDWIRIWKPQGAQNITMAWPEYKEETTWEKTQVVASNLATSHNYHEVVTAVAPTPVYSNSDAPQYLFFTTVVPNGTKSLKYVECAPGTTWQIQPALDYAGLDVTNVRPGSRLVSSPGSARVIYAGDDGLLWYYEPITGISAALIPSAIPNATHDQQELGLDPAPDPADPAVANTSRIYYTTPNQELWYYEYKPGSGWTQHYTGVNNAAGSFSVVGGRVYYKSTAGSSLGNDLWVYFYNPQGHYWQSQNLNPGCYPHDVAKVVGGVPFNSRPYGTRVYYLSTGSAPNGNELKYYEYTTYRDQVQTIPPGCTGRLATDYLNKYDACTPGGTGPGVGCLYNGYCPGWKYNETGNTDFADNAGITHFNNQLIYFNADGGIDEYRSFKRWNADRHRLDFDPAALWYKSPGPATSTIEPDPYLGEPAFLFGMDDNRLYCISGYGDVFLYESNEVLNPATNTMGTAGVIPRRPAPGSPKSVGSMRKASAPGAGSLLPDQVSVYPNPTSANVTFSHLTGTIARIEVWDMVGNRVLEAEPQQVSATLKVGVLRPGMYFYRVTDHERNVSTGKFSKN